jgi:hypothetical protein
MASIFVDLFPGEPGSRELIMWVVYDSPRDFPNSFVARRWVGELPTQNVMIGPDLDQLRTMLAQHGLICVPRLRDDDPKIVEVWM